MVVLQDPHSRGPQITLSLHRRHASSTSENLSKFNRSYIIIALVLVILASLLLVALLQYQSRRIDERLQAVIAAHHPRPTLLRPRSTTPTPGPFISTRPPPASFPSVSCHGSIPDSSIKSDNSLDSDATIPPISSQLLLPSHLKKKTSFASSPPSSLFKFLDEPIFPTSLQSLHSTP